MSRYQQLFTRLAQQHEGAFVPFVTLGDPNFELSLQIIDHLIAGGADALELGIPFSDPLADGPTIQNANLRAFKSGITVERCFEMLENIRTKHPDIPIGLLLYANLVFNNGIDQFYAKCAKAGVDSVLVADVPLQESQPFRTAAEKYQIAPIFICPPNADDAIISLIAQYGRSYTYLLSRTGVTGAENHSTQSLKYLVQKLKQYNAPPAIQGFGISQPQQVKESITDGAVGAISGSATIKIIEHNLANPPKMLTELQHFAEQMKAATKK